MKLLRTFDGYKHVSWYWRWKFKKIGDIRGVESAINHIRSITIGQVLYPDFETMQAPDSPVLQNMRTSLQQMFFEGIPTAGPHIKLGAVMTALNRKNPMIYIHAVNALLEWSRHYDKALEDALITVSRRWDMLRTYATDKYNSAV